MKKALLFVGLDVHAQSITVAVVGNDRNQPRLYGRIPNDLHAMERMLAKLKNTIRAPRRGHARIGTPEARGTSG